jgi:ABC-type nitrate/sulfonate/bicarbonate transport system ATPase subunit
MVETKGTLLFITHDLSEAVRIGSRILVLSANPGQVVYECDGVADANDGHACADLEAHLATLLQH